MTGSLKLFFHEYFSKKDLCVFFVYIVYELIDFLKIEFRWLLFMRNFLIIFYKKKSFVITLWEKWKQYLYW